MTDEQLLERITLNPRVMAGKAVIKGTRLTVDHIFNLFAHGMSTAEILEEYPGPDRGGHSRVLSFRCPFLGGHCVHAAGSGEVMDAVPC